MATIALIVFAAAAIGGLILAAAHFQGRPLPMPISVIHGAAGATGLVLLGLVVFGSEPAPARVPLAALLLVVAALGGFFLFSFHLRGQRAPSPAIVVHALIAVAGVVTLLIAVL